MSLFNNRLPIELLICVICLFFLLFLLKPQYLVFFFRSKPLELKTKPFKINTLQLKNFFRNLFETKKSFYCFKLGWKINKGGGISVFLFFYGLCEISNHSALTSSACEKNWYPFLGVEFVSAVWLGVLPVSWESNQVVNVIFMAVL